MSEQPRKVRKSRFTEAGTQELQPVTKKSRWESAAPAATSAASGSGGAVAHSGAIRILAAEKEKSAMDLQRQIDQQMKMMGLITSTTVMKPVSEGPKRIQMDELGRMVDEQGRVIETEALNVSSLKVNQRKAQEEKEKEQLRVREERDEVKKAKLSQFVDKSLVATEKKERRRAGFNFIEEGSFSKRAEELREKNQTLFNFDKDGEEPTKRFQAVGVAAPIKEFDPIPEVEWWDAKFLLDDKTNLLNESGAAVTEEENLLPKHFSYNLEKITDLVEHPPVVIPERHRKSGKEMLPMYLTAKEQKKKRRIARQEREKEKQDLLKLGLIKVEGPKLKVSNMVNVLGEEAVMNPSAAEKLARKAMQDRLKAHLKRNEERKLTKEERGKKITKKFEREEKDEIRAVLIRIKSFESKLNKIKIDKNARQLHLAGLTLIGQRISQTAITGGRHIPNIIIAQGGRRAIRKFKVLCFRRINWELQGKLDEDEEGGPVMMDHDQDMDNDEDREEDQSGDEDESVNFVKNNTELKSSKKGHAVLLWEGVLQERLFERWKVIQLRSEAEAKKILSEKGVENYWDMAMTYQVDK